MIFTNDHPPPRVHVRKGAILAKIGLEPEVVLLRYDKDFAIADIRKMIAIVKDNQDFLLENGVNSTRKTLRRINMSDINDLLKNAVPYDDSQRPIGVEFKEGMLLVRFQDGRLIGTPLDWYPRLMAATPEQLKHYELSTFGIHWEELDEDLSIEGMLQGIQPKPRMPQKS